MKRVPHYTLPVIMTHEKSVMASALVDHIDLENDSGLRYSNCAVSTERRKCHQMAALRRKASVLSRGDVIKQFYTLVNGMTGDVNE